jgi:hypothetical protein
MLVELAVRAVRAVVTEITVINLSLRLLLALVRSCCCCFAARCCCARKLAERWPDERNGIYQLSVLKPWYRVGLAAAPGALQLLARAPLLM